MTTDVTADPVGLPKTSEGDDLTLYQQRLVDGTTVLDQRQQTRMPLRPTGPLAEAWDPRLPYELALEMAEPLEVFSKFGIEKDDAIVLLQNPVFVAKLRGYRAEIVAKGTSFRLKAKVQAEDLLTHSYDMATDPETPPSVRADLIKWTAAVAELGPPKEIAKDGGGGGAGGGFTLNITFTGTSPAGTPAIDVTPSSKEISP
jgi:hypothetical protein